MWLILLSQTISAQVDFWSRECELYRPCQNLPVPMAPAYVIEGEIAEPQSLGESSQKNFEINHENLKAQVSFFWGKPQTGDPRVVTQVVLFHDGVRVAQCSWYQKPESAFPVTPGACSGFLKAENSIQKQVGVSFSKTQ